MVWNPEYCKSCYEKMEAGPLNDNADTLTKARLTDKIKGWVRGYGKNRKDKPFLLWEFHRKLLFPNAPSSK